AGLVLANVGVSSFVVAFWSVSSSLLRGTAGATAIALVNSVGNIGGLLGPFTMGRLKDTTGGMVESFLLLAGLALVTSLLFFVYRSRPAFGVVDGRRVAQRLVPAHAEQTLARQARFEVADGSKS